MGSVKWTDSQRDAIYATGGTVLVSAAAGSGKTAVLVERVIELITDSGCPIDADRLLVVTYTKAAAGEMKERIAARIEELLEENPFSELLHRQQLLLSRAKISTIHSFCSDIAKEYFHVINIPNDFRIGEEKELELLKSLAMQSVLERKYSEKDSVFENTVEVFSSTRDDTILQEIVLKLYEFLRSNPFPEKWVKEKSAMYDVAKQANETEWGLHIIERSKMMTVYIRTLSDMNISLMDRVEKLRDSSFGDAIRDDALYIKHLAELLDSGNWNGIVSHLNGYKPKNLTTPKGFKEDETKIAIANYRDNIKGTIKDMQSLFVRNNEQCMDDIANLAPIVSKLFEIMEEFGDEYARMKAERSLADYSDLEHWALRLLAENTEDGIIFTEIAKEISSRYDFVMVDEYQDANNIQDTIFQAVSDNDKKLFVVGDVKQSIYRFRQAMPEIFISRKDRYCLYDREKDNYPAKIILDRNFRSREGITEGVNFVFKNLMSRSVGDIDYTDEETLKAGASYDEDNGNAVSFHLLELNGSPSEDSDTEEARYIGTQIRRIMSTFEVTSKGEKRKASYGDFCILIRSVKNHALVFTEELLKMGIPAVSETSDSFFSQHEVQVVLSLLRVIDNPVRDIPLAAVLLSPIFGFTADELAEYRAKYPKGSLYSLILAENAAGNEKTLNFTEKLSKWRKIASEVTSDKFLNILYNETSYPEIVSADKDGDFRKNNLRLIIHYAKSYESNGYKGVSGFIKFMDRLRENSKDLAAADRGTQAYSDAVRIMTIHKSKGLEFPICFVANLNRKIRTDTTADVLLHNELGLGVRRKDDVRHCRYTTMPREAVALRIKQNEMSEELRILYVALTRAKERLILVGSVKDTEKYIRGVVEKFAYNEAVLPYTVSSAKCLCDWIADCLLVHRDGYELRQKGNYTGKIYKGETSGWDVKIIENLPEYYGALTEEDSDKKEDVSEQTIFEIAESTKKEYLNILGSRLRRTYEHEKLTQVPVKVSASALTRAESDNVSLITSVPAFMRQGGLSGAERGTAMHAFVQYCDLERARKSVDKEISQLADKGFLTEEQGKSINRKNAYIFLHSELTERMLRADFLEREFRFTVDIPARMADETLEPPYSEEPIILQGAVDCLFEEGGELIIVDYKTDYCRSKEELAEKYKTQLKLYKLAVEQIMEKPVTKCIIYSFAMGDYFSLF